MTLSYFLCLFSLLPLTPAGDGAAVSAVLQADAEMLVVKVNNGRCELYSASTGSYRRSFGSNVVQASVSGDNVAVVTQSGRVEIYTASTGSYRRSFGSDAVSAQIQGDDVAVTKKNGRIEIYTVSTGSYRRSL